MTHIFGALIPSLISFKVSHEDQVYLLEESKLSETNQESKEDYSGFHSAEKILEKSEFREDFKQFLIKELCVENLLVNIE